MQLRVELDCSEMHSAIMLLSAPEAGPAEKKAKLASVFAETVQTTELTKRNLSLSLWTKLRMPEEEFRAWNPQPGFSVYLETQAQLALAGLRKSQALRVRLSAELEEAEAKNPQMAQELVALRAKTTLELLKAESAAEKLGQEVLSKASNF